MITIPVLILCVLLAAAGGYIVGRMHANIHITTIEIQHLDDDTNQERTDG